MAKKTVKKSRTVRPSSAKASVQQVQSQPVQPVQQPVSSNGEISETMGIVCLLLNILVLPGLGSLIAKRTKQGTWQLVMAIVSIPLMFIIVGFFLWGAAWIWSLITGLDILKKVKKN